MPSRTSKPRANERRFPPGSIIAELWSKTGAGVVIALAVAIAVVYWPAVSGEFILDDDVLLTDSSLIRSPDGLYRFWCTTEAADYWPLSNSTLWLEWRLWGMNPTGYHVTNLLLHLAGCVLLWLVLRRLEIPCAFLAAMLFAVHPVNVESVAWIAQRKNVLAMALLLLSVLWYLRADGNSSTAADPRRRTALWYALSLVAFVLAMLSKGSVAVGPLLLLVITWWQRGHITQRDLVRTAPFFLVAAVLTAVNIWFQTHGSGEVIREATWAQRLAGAGAAVWFYLFHAVAPVRLAFIYPQWNIDTSNGLWWIPLVAAVAVTALLWWQRESRWGRPLLAAWIFYCVALLPVLGFTDVGFMKHSLVADHYQHLALLSVVALVGAGWSNWYRHAQRQSATAPLATAAFIVGAFLLLARQQSALYRDAETLYVDTLAKNPGCWMAHYNLGVLLNDRDRPQDALPHFAEGLRLKPDYPECEVSLGLTKSRLGKVQESLAHYQHVLQKHPQFVAAHNNLGLALAALGQREEARAHYEEALRIDPNSAEAHNNLGILLANADRLDDAMQQYAAALKILPNYAEAHNNLANALAAKGEFPAAIDHYEQALRARPNYAEAHKNLGAVQAATGKMESATSHFEDAIRFRPDFLEAAIMLSEAYAQQGRFSEAASTAQKALDLARAEGQAELAEQISQRLNLFRQGLTGAK